MLRDWYGVRVHKHQVEPTDKGEQVEYCHGCEEEPSGQMYYCNLCRYFFHETCANLPLQITHLFHPCPLTLYIAPEFTCNACFEEHSNSFTYRCEKCKYDMDAKCAVESLSTTSDGGEDRALHCCHPHPLIPLPIKTEPLVSCQICEAPCSSGQTWGCEPCNFQVHKSCLELLPEKIHIKLHSTRAASPFVLQTSPLDKECFDCKQTIDGDLAFCRCVKDRYEFLCISCCLVRRMVDESSSEVAREIKHFFHPCPLKLVFSPFSICNACFQTCPTFLYYCNDCDFFLDLQCAQLADVSHGDKPNQIYHFCHQHPLMFFQDIEDRPTSCKLCGSFCSESFYGCSQCHFYIHKTCMDILPQKTTHPVLNQTITLLPLLSFNCTTCNRPYSGLAFHDMKQKHKFCVKCILWPVENKLVGDEKFKSIHHWHHLSIGQTDKIKQVICFMCGEYCSGTYICKECNIFFHKGCTKLPTELIRHPIHPHHSLTLTDQSTLNVIGVIRCKLCLKDLSQGFSTYNKLYQCQECYLYLDTRCASSLPSIQYERHIHLLYLVENLHDEARCKLCKSSCKGSSVLRCPVCNFNVHLICGPLPSSVSHSCHVHPFTLKEYYVEDNEADEFACHICENRREPKERIYHCIEGCPMICEIKCLPEVLKSLRGKRGAMELKTLYPEVPCKVIIGKDSILKEMSLAIQYGGAIYENLPMNKNIFLWNALRNVSDSDYDEKEIYGIDVLEKACINESSNQEEDETEDATEVARQDDNQGKSDFMDDSKFHISSYWPCLDDVYEKICSMLNGYGTAMDSDHRKVLNELLGYFSSNIDKCPYIYSLKGFKVFMKDLDHVHMNEDDDAFSKHNGSRMAGVYSLPEVLNPIYEDFFSKYEVFSAESSRFGFLKRRYIVFIICCVLHEMRMTKVVDTKTGKIGRWICALKKLEKRYGIQLGFMIDHIKQIGKAHFLVQARHLVDSKLSKLNDEIRQLSEQEQELTDKLEMTKMKLQEKKKGKEVYDAYKVLGANSLKKEYKDALEIKWRSCYEVSVDYQKQNSS